MFLLAKMVIFAAFSMQSQVYTRWIKTKKTKKIIHLKQKLKCFTLAPAKQKPWSLQLTSFYYDLLHNSVFFFIENINVKKLD